MISFYCRKYLHILSFVCTLFPFVCSTNIDFDQFYNGVVLSPFPKHKENGVIPGVDQYTLQEIKTMCQVVSTRFQMTATYRIGANHQDEKYIRSVSYKQTREKNVLVPEAASLVNKDHQRLAITVLAGIGRWHGSSKRNQLEIELAFEAAQIANTIHPGTAKGLIFHSNDIGVSAHQATDTFNKITEHKLRAHRESLLVGTRQDCQLITMTADEDGKNAARIFEEIVKQSDFIICSIKPDHKYFTNGVKSVMNFVDSTMKIYKSHMKKTNPSIEVMLETGWPSKGSFGYESVGNMKNYWQEINKWAVKMKTKVWMYEAFDQYWPYDTWTSQSSHFGWWKLGRNADAGKMKGYTEKIFSKAEEEEKDEVSPKETSATTNKWIYVGAVIGAIGLLALIAVNVVFYERVRKLSNTLTQADIQDFVYGISPNNEYRASASGTNEYSQEIEENILRFPYDKKNLELSKDKIVIDLDNLLGSGHFGCVYKAIAQTNDGETRKVALKMAKSDCPKQMLISLLSEIKILSYLGKHPNVVSILGAYTGEMEKGIVYIATELCPLGSLESFLRKQTWGLNSASSAPNDDDNNSHSSGNMDPLTNEKGITILDMLNWSHDIANGMEFLGIKKVVHADLSTRNVLLSLSKTAKITDFGLSRRLYECTNYMKQKQEPLPWRWMAIESLKRLKFSSQSDVWSFGITLWEIFSLGDTPYPGLSWNLSFVETLENGLRMSSPRYATRDLYEIMIQCWDEEPNQRPTFPQIKTLIAQIIINDATSDNNI